MSAHPNAHDSARPIGVFDSGVGGLSVLHEIRRALPAEHLHYVADSGHAPYGDKSAHHIEQRALHILDVLLSQGVKAVVVACNTVTGLAIQALRAHAPTLPIVAIEPAVKPAARTTRSGVVGVLATRQTVASPGLARLLQTHAQGARMVLQACPGWVERVERGELEGPDTEAVVAEYVQPLLDQGADTLVLGCTHYPFLAPVIQRLAGPGVAVLDPAPAVARELQRRLAALDLLLPPACSTGRERFWSSGPLERAQTVMARLWHQPTLTVQPLPSPHTLGGPAA